MIFICAHILTFLFSKLLFIIAKNHSYIKQKTVILTFYFFFYESNPNYARIAVGSVNTEQPDLLKQACPIEDMTTLPSKRASCENPQTIYRYSILCTLPLKHGKRRIKLDFIESEDL